MKGGIEVKAFLGSCIVQRHKYLRVLDHQIHDVYNNFKNNHFTDWTVAQ